MQSLAGQSFKMFEWSMAGQPATNYQPYWCKSIEASKIFLKIFLKWYLLKGHVQTVPYVVLENLFQKDFSKRFLKVQLNCTRLKIFLRKILNKSFKKIFKKAIELRPWSWCSPWSSRSSWTVGSTPWPCRSGSRRRGGRRAPSTCTARPSCGTGPAASEIWTRIIN